MAQISSIVKLSLASLLLASPLLAGDHAIHNASRTRIAAITPESVPTQANSNNPDQILILSAAPRETPAAGRAIYEPIARYLSAVTGKPVHYKHPGTWTAYQTAMLKGSYDILFDGPHFNSLRADKLGYRVLAKVPEQSVYTLVVKQNKIQTLSQLAHQNLCAPALPDFATLTILEQLSGQSVVPVLIDTKEPEQVYHNVVSGKCNAGLLPLASFAKFNTAQLLQVLLMTGPLPSDAFSAGPRVTPTDRSKITAALSDDTAREPTAQLRAALAFDEVFKPADNEEYVGLATLLLHPTPKQ